MIEGNVVIDATVHGFNFTLENCRTEVVRQLRDHLHEFNVTLTPGTEYDLTREELYEQFADQPELLPQMMFAESHTDVAVYHAVPLEGLYYDGSSPLWVGVAAAERYPERVYNYAAVYPWREDAIERLEREAQQRNVIGVKFYPADLIGEQFVPSLMNAESTFRVVERCRELGIRMIGIHKAVPIGPFREVQPYFGVADCPPLVEAFPDMTFEIVHGGFAFLPETVELMRRYPNVVVNLEGVQTFMHGDPIRWNELIGAFLAVDGGEDRIFWSVAASALHPAPWVPMFWRWELPAGFPPLTQEIKAKILGGNYARAMGWDLPALAARLASDPFGTGDPVRPPWSWLREQRAGRAAGALAAG
ncbi:MAG: amidohydrolase family protein [Kineosporiaceae bacterium]